MLPQQSEGLHDILHPAIIARDLMLTKIKHDTGMLLYASRALFIEGGIW